MATGEGGIEGLGEDALGAPRFHHLGVAVRDLQRGAESLARLFGFRVLAGPFDDPLQGVAVSFVGSGAPGEILYELVAPLAGGGPSPIDRILERGNTSYHVCYEVRDLDETLARFLAEGCARISGPVAAVAFGGRRIAWVVMPTRHIVELLEAERGSPADVAAI